MAGRGAAASGGPAREIGADIVVVGECQVGGADAVDLGGVAGAQPFLRVEAPIPPEESSASEPEAMELPPVVCDDLRSFGPGNVSVLRFSEEIMLLLLDD